MRPVWLHGIAIGSPAKSFCIRPFQQFQFQIYCTEDTNTRFLGMYQTLLRLCYDLNN